jgi:hypothetical protein
VATSGPGAGRAEGLALLSGAIDTLFSLPPLETANLLREAGVRVECEAGHVLRIRVV